MSRQPTAVHVARIKSSHVDKRGRHREYESRYLRRTYRRDGKVKHETLANLSGLPDEVVEAIDAALKGTRLVAADAAVTITRSVPHGHVAAAHAMAKALGLPAVFGPGLPGAGLGVGVDHLAGGQAWLEAVYPDLVGRHHVGC
jgi:hypothetical protein